MQTEENQVIGLRRLKVMRVDIFLAKLNNTFPSFCEFVHNLFCSKGYFQFFPLQKSEEWLNRIDRLKQVNRVSQDISNFT